ncbi:hypothetical protein ACLOJK_005735 [Asimina triloba]
MDPTASSDRPPSKAQALQSLASGPLAASISSLSASSRPIPSQKDFHFYYNFDEFKLPIKAISDKSESLLKSITFGGGPVSVFPSGADQDDAYDWLVNLNEDIFERIDVSLDEFQRARKQEERLGVAAAAAAATADGFQLVYGKKKKKGGGERHLEGSGGRGSAAASTVRMASKDANKTGERPRVPFHIPTIPRPQDEYCILVNNSNRPFEHVWLQRSEDDGRPLHPLEKHSEADFVDRSVVDVEPIKPLPLESTPFHLVEGVNELKALAAKLRDVNEFAVDLEHNSYRSFQGLTCLMQISTRTEDFVVDTLKLRIHIGPHLREVFKDTSKRKVMHGADRDVLWLQRDFGIYICNLFDTGQASRVLQLERNSLEYLLHHFCGVTANKEYQNADWRLRPLPDEMIRYAREDTHYLLHIYDLMRVRLLSASAENKDGGDLLLEVYKRSYEICINLYEKELLTETSYLYIYGWETVFDGGGRDDIENGLLQSADFNSQQLAVVAGLCQWRDIVARDEDESTGYILPNKALLEIARHMPTTTGKLSRLVRSKHPYVERNLGSVVGIIRTAITNAAAFESACDQLKKMREEMVREQNTGAADDAQPVRAPENHMSVETSFPQPESLNGLTVQTMEVSANVKESAEQESMNVCPGGDKRSISSEKAYTKKLSEEARMETSHSVKPASVASVQILKKPSRAFGAMLGNSVSKRKLDDSQKGNSVEQAYDVDDIENQIALVAWAVALETAHVGRFWSYASGVVAKNNTGVEVLRKDPEKAEVKVEQIKSSVTLPFHSFSGNSKQSRLVSDESINCCKPLQSEANEPLCSESNDCACEPAEVVKLEEVIPLETGDDDRGSSPESATADMLENGNARDPASGSEAVDEPTSLSDLASSFEEFFKQKRKAKQAELRSEESDNSFQLKPFDYAAARKQNIFAAQEAEEAAEGNKGASKLALDSKERRRGLIPSPAQREEGSKEFPQARRRQAFPASGNRSATFR